MGLPGSAECGPGREQPASACRLHPGLPARAGPACPSRRSRAMDTARTDPSPDDVLQLTCFQTVTSCCSQCVREATTAANCDYRRARRRGGPVVSAAGKGGCADSAGGCRVMRQGAASCDARPSAPASSVPAGANAPSFAGEFLRMEVVTHGWLPSAVAGLLQGRAVERRTLSRTFPGSVGGHRRVLRPCLGETSSWALRCLRLAMVGFATRTQILQQT